MVVVKPQLDSPATLIEKELIRFIRIKKRIKKRKGAFSFLKVGLTCLVLSRNTA